MSRKLQIGVMGSAADLNYSAKTELLATEVGKLLAKREATVIFGAEKDYDSLSTVAARSAQAAGGRTVGITYGKSKPIFSEVADVVIATGLERGGGREFSLVLSCDAIICIGGGSGTLTEMAVAYQANIPIVALADTGGWAERLTGQYIDARERVRVEKAKTPADAVNKVLTLASTSPEPAKDILLLAGTHGDEGFTIPVLEQLTIEFPGRFSWVTANEPAVKKNVRFTDADLNRSAPGKKSSKVYEEQRAYELLKLARDYSYVIDLHGTTANSGIFTIVANPTPANLMLAGALPIDNVVIWAAKESEQSGPLTQFVECGVEIECGPKNSKQVQKELEQKLRLIVEQGITPNIQSVSDKNYYRVYGKLNTNARIKELKDFQKATVDGETFFPLLVGQYKDATCYKMERVNFGDVFGY